MNLKMPGKWWVTAGARVFLGLLLPAAAAGARGWPGARIACRRRIRVSSSPRNAPCSCGLYFRMS